VTGDVPADLVVDARGRRCPLPIIDLARRITDVPVGAVVAVVADDPAARHDVPAWCEMRGHDYLGERAAASADGTPAYLVRRTS
jgi:TusA-related sulfurtransferase